MDQTCINTIHGSKVKGLQQNEGKLKQGCYILTGNETIKCMVKNQLQHAHKSKDKKKKKNDDRNKGYIQAAICDCASSSSCSSP
jgi:hypothetical protein